MMRGLIAVSIRRHGVVALLTLLAVLVGAWQARQAPLDVFPDFVPSEVDIQTEAPGFSPEQVEALITRPVEHAVSGAAGIATFRSESMPGLSVVTIGFADGLDVHVARQGIAERLAELGGTLPAGAGVPRLSPLVSSTMDLLKIGLRSDRADAYALRDLADWVIKPRLLAVPGVAHVLVFGGDVRQIQIVPDPAKLASFALTFADVVDAARAALPVRGAGFVDTASQRVLLQSPVPAPDLERLRQAVITTRSATPILLRDVATLGMAPAPRFGDALIMGRPGVLLSLASQYGANTLATTHAVESALADLEPALAAQGVTLYGGLHRPANFIERALGNLQRSLLGAALLILISIYAFLRNLRAAIIAFMAIPLSLLATVAVLRHFGETLNTMTLGGFAVALGVLVDDAIIGIENILRRLRTEAASASPRLRLDVIREATLEVRQPVIYATLVVIAIFVPELLTSSIQGRFVGPLALAFIAAVGASLLVAVTSTPALCALLLRGSDHPAEARWLVRLKSLQAAALEWVGARLSLVLLALSILTLAAGAALPFLGGTFMPDFREDHFVMQVRAAVPGISIEEMRAAGARISREVLALPYVRSVEEQIGRAELGEDTWGPHQGELHVELRPGSGVDQEKAQDDLRRILSSYPGLQGEVVTFLGDRISESLSGIDAQVAIKVFGPDLDALDAVGRDIVAALGHVPNVADLELRRESGTPALAIRPRTDVIAAAGLKLQDVLDTIETAYAGSVAGQTFEGSRTVEVVVRLPEALRHAPSSLGGLLIPSPLGPVPLSQIAQIELTQDRYRIRHDGGQRLVAVTFNAASGSLQNLIAAARRAVAAAVTLPPGVFLEFGGVADAELQTREQLMLYSALALSAIGVLLFVAFRWRANVWLVLTNLPFSLIGSVAAIAIGGLGLSLGTTVGLVTVFGISVRGALLQLAHYEHLVCVEQHRFGTELVIRGANERLVPILMTATVTALGLAPLALGLGRPGEEIEGPMAITVLGGLISCTLLNILVLPALARRFLDPTADGRTPRTSGVPMSG